MSDRTEGVAEGLVALIQDLPVERQKVVEEWFFWQRAMVEAMGLEPETWFEYVGWALKNFGDFSFIDDFPDPEEAKGKDGLEGEDGEATGRRRLLATEEEKGAIATAESKGIKGEAGAECELGQELFQRFMNQNIQFGAGPGRRRSGGRR